MYSRGTGTPSSINSRSDSVRLNTGISMASSACVSSGRSQSSGRGVAQLSMLLRRLRGDDVGAQCPGGGGGSARRSKGVSQLHTEDSESSDVSDPVSESL